MRDEAHATRVSADIRDEIHRATRVNIGVAGLHPTQPVPSRAELVALYGGLRPAGGSASYEQYYDEGFRQRYQPLYSPDAPRWRGFDPDAPLR